jgi:LAGLIDADG DNA endonuclease family/Proton-conducting membrane transporter
MINLSAMDMGLSIGFFAIFALFGSLDYATVFSLVPFMNETAITIIGLLLLTGAMAKSAQIPLHSWLPGSMEGLNLIIALATRSLPYFLFLFFFNNLYLDLENIVYISMIFPVIPPKVKDALTGDLLGDGHLRFTHKDKNGNFTGNSHYAMTLKNYDYAFYLWKEIYSSICTSTPLRPWPNPKTGMCYTTNPSQYAFSSRSLPDLTVLHKQWYVLNKETKKFIKIVPLNIEDLLTSIGLAHWIMGDGYWDSHGKTVDICTDNFTLSEVELLIRVLKDKFNLLATIKRRIKANKEVCWRIRFSGKPENLSNLKSLVQPHFFPSMLYKLNISID